MIQMNIGEIGRGDEGEVMRMGGGSAQVDVSA